MVHQEILSIKRENLNMSEINEICRIADRIEQWAERSETLALSILKILEEMEDQEKIGGIFNE
jgi:hypothetical protein